MDDQGNFKGGIGVRIEGEKAWVQILAKAVRIMAERVEVKHACA